MNYGFITSLPRSGSAWIANYLSYGNVMMLHDAWKEETPTELKMKFEKANAYAAGTSDPANVLMLKEIDKEFPEAKWVVVTRPPKDVEKACKTINFPFADWTGHLKNLMGSRDVFKVQFNELFDRADEIGRFIYPDWECPKWRKDALKDMNVQLHWGKVSDQFVVPVDIAKNVDVLTPKKMQYFRTLREIVRDDPNAIRFLAQLRDISEVWRALDKKAPINIPKAKKTIESMITEWLTNPFINNFSQTLAPAIAASIERYKTTRPESCVIDNDLVAIVAYIYQGQLGVEKFMPKIRELSKEIMEERYA
jgi:hypothetical protein